MAAMNTASQIESFGQGIELSSSSLPAIFLSSTEDLSDNHKPIKPTAPREDLNNSSQKAPALHKPGETYTYHGTTFGSLSEAATATLMEKYIPGFKIIEGDTFQIRTGPKNHHRIDFRIGGTLVEYHPTNLIYEFGGPEAYRRLERKLEQLPIEVRARIMSDKISSIAHRYEMKRQELIEADPHLRNMSLVIVHSPEELYDKVLKRFGNNLATREETIDEFFEITRDVKRSCGAGYRREGKRKAA